MLVKAERVSGRRLAGVRGLNSSEMGWQKMAAGLWDFANVETLYDLPFVELVNMAQRVHRNQFDPCEVGVSDLMPEQAWPAAVQIEGSRSRMVSRIVELANLEPYPQAVPVALAADCAAHGPPGRGVDPIDFVRTVAIVRVTMPPTLIGVSLGPLAVEVQALCFLAGANMICLEDARSPLFRVPAIHPIESLSRLGLRVRGPSGLHH